jgi:hypothetical protein
MTLIIIASILIGVIFTFLVYKFGDAPCPEWVHYCASFYLSSLSSYIILFHIFIK